MRFNKGQALALYENELFQATLKAMEKESYENFVASSFQDENLRNTARIQINTLRELRNRIEFLTKDTIETPKKHRA